MAYIYCIVLHKPLSSALGLRLHPGTPPETFLTKLNTVLEGYVRIFLYVNLSLYKFLKKLINRTTSSTQNILAISLSFRVYSKLNIVRAFEPPEEKALVRLLRTSDHLFVKNSLKIRRKQLNK